MVIAVYRCTDPTGGFALTKDLGAFKLYFNDTGLFTSIVFPSTKNDGGDIYQRLILDKLKTNLGMLFENVAAQTLVANAFEPFYYSWSQSSWPCFTCYSRIRRTWVFSLFDFSFFK
jgi:hypothetical protein